MVFIWSKLQQNLNPLTVAVFHWLFYLPSNLFVPSDMSLQINKIKKYSNHTYHSRWENPMVQGISLLAQVSNLVEVVITTWHELMLQTVDQLLISGIHARAAHRLFPTDCWRFVRPIQTDDTVPTWKAITSKVFVDWTEKKNYEQNLPVPAQRKHSRSTVSRVDSSWKRN